MWYGRFDISAGEHEPHSCEVGAAGQVQPQMTLLALKVVE
jgi:hypothetical protein